MVTSKVLYVRKVMFLYLSIVLTHNNPECSVLCEHAGDVYKSLWMWVTELGHSCVSLIHTNKHAHASLHNIEPMDLIMNPLLSGWKDLLLEVIEVLFFICRLRGSKLTETPLQKASETLEETGKVLCSHRSKVKVKIRCIINGWD